MEYERVSDDSGTDQYGTTATETVATSNIGVTGKASKSSYSLGEFWQRIKRLDFIVVYGSLLILSILLIVMIFIGDSTAWYNSLVQPSINPWYVRGLWVVGTILSYVGFYFVGESIKDHEVPIDLILTTYFIITDLIFLGWAAAFYYAENIALSVWIALLLFIYNFWLLLYIWRINVITAIFLIPNLILYVYLMYQSLHIASLNEIPI